MLTNILVLVVGHYYVVILLLLDSVLHKLYPPPRIVVSVFGPPARSMIIDWILHESHGLMIFHIMAMECKRILILHSSWSLAKKT